MASKGYVNMEKVTTQVRDLHLQFEGITYRIQVTPEEEEKINADPDYAYALCLNLRNEVLQNKAEGEPRTLAENTSENVKAEEFVWSDAATFLLLEEYMKRKEQFRNPKVKKRELWNDMKNIFKTHSYKVTCEELDKKFRNMKQTYFRIKDSQNVKKRTGQGSIRWKFYDIMREIFQLDENVTSPVQPIESATCQQYKATTPVCNQTDLAVSKTLIKPRLHTTTADSLQVEIPSTSFDSCKTPRHSRLPSECSATLTDRPSLREISPNGQSVPSPTTTMKDRGTIKRKARKNLQSYRNDFLKTERDRVAAVRDLRSSIDENTNVVKTLIEIQKERNELLRQLVNK